MHALLLILALSSGELAAARPATDATSQPERFEVRVTPEMERHSRIRDLLYFTGNAYAIGVLLLLLAGGLSHRMRSAARRITRRRTVSVMLYFVLFSLAAAILHFPLTLYAGYVVPHLFDLSDQRFASWLGDLLKALAADIVVGAPLAALALFAIRRFERWWIPVWLGSIPLMILGVVIAPVLFDPLFNHFEPLRDPALRRRLLDEAARAGIENSRVYQVDASKQTKTMNAYVTGIGPTKRIVLWDTLLAKLDQDEIVATMGHEMGHYVLHHLWKGLAFAVFVSLAVCFIAQLLYERGLRKWGVRWGIEERADAAAIPWLLTIVTMLTFFLAPVINGFSRRIEHEADRFGLELTHLNEATASSFVKFAEDSKVDPRPNRFIAFWRYSHPPLQERIDFALRYRPGQASRSLAGAPRARR